jgi:hypothetical protein
MADTEKSGDVNRPYKETGHLFTSDAVSVEMVSEFQKKLDLFDVKDIGQGRSGGFDRETLMKKIIFLHRKTTIPLDTYVKIVKTFGIKFCLHGTRIKPDNRVTIDGKEYTADNIASLFEFKQSGIQTDQTQLTPTRMARLFATEAVEYCQKNSYNPAMYLQEDLQVLGLPAEYHFLAAIYADGSSLYAQQLIVLGKKFDAKMADAIQGWDRTRGFGVRFTYFFQNVKVPGKESFGSKHPTGVHTDKTQDPKSTPPKETERKPKKEDKPK